MIQPFSEEQVRKAEELAKELFLLISSAEIGNQTWRNPVDILEMKELAKSIAMARQMLNGRKSEMFHEHKQAAYFWIREVDRSHNIWWKYERRYRENKVKGITDKPAQISYNALPKP